MTTGDTMVACVILLIGPPLVIMLWSLAISVIADVFGGLKR